MECVSHHAIDNTDSIGYCESNDITNCSILGVLDISSIKIYNISGINLISHFKGDDITNRSILGILDISNIKVNNVSGVDDSS